VDQREHLSWYAFAKLTLPKRGFDMVNFKPELVSRRKALLFWAWRLRFASQHPPRY
jgi:hypothetical protein